MTFDVLDCPQEEFFSDGECKKKCASNEVRVDKIGCKKSKKFLHPACGMQWDARCGKKH